MTVYEHAMIGINGSLALGLQRRHGWQIVAWAGLAAVLPDADGMTILLGGRMYADGHRLWGHNLLAVGLVAAVASAVVHRADLLIKAQRWLAGRWKALSIGDGLTQPSTNRRRELPLWIAVGVAAAYSHLLMDVFFSGGHNFQNWGVPLFWPFSRTEWAYPLVPWGNIGATLIFAASMFAMLRWRARTGTIAALSLIAVGLYMIVCGQLCWAGG